MELDFPNTRLENASVGNPLFVSDIVNATQGIQAAMQSLTDLRSTDFAIISGLDYSAGTYTSGIVWLGDGFYYFNGTLAEGYYLIPNVTNVENKIFSDSIIRPIYSINYCAQSATPYGSNPIFSGAMDQYRLGTKWIKGISDNWHTASFNPSYWILPATYTLNYKLDRDGNLVIFGAIQRIGSGALVFTLPVGYRPTNNTYITVSEGYISNSPKMIQIKSDGTVNDVNVTSGILYFNNIIILS